MGGTCGKVVGTPARQNKFTLTTENLLFGTGVRPWETFAHPAQALQSFKRGNPCYMVSQDEQVNVMGAFVSDH